MSRQDQRKNKRRALGYQARINAIGGDGQISCIIKDVSETGARVATHSPDQLPDAFVLCLTADGLPRRHCRVVWRSETEAGVNFVRPPVDREVTEMGVAVQPSY
jgi:hypothetical protein